MSNHDENERLTKFFVELFLWHWYVVFQIFENKLLAANFIVGLEKFTDPTAWRVIASTFLELAVIQKTGLAASILSICNRKADTWVFFGNSIFPLLPPKNIDSTRRYNKASDHVKKEITVCHSEVIYVQSL